MQDPQGLGQHVEQVLLDDGRDVSHPQVSAEKFNHMAENRWRNDNVIHAPKTIMDVLILEG